MRKCKGRYYKKGEWVEFTVGYFHQWGSNYEEFENGAGNFTIAIVELPDGKIVTPLADEIQFIEPIEPINKVKINRGNEINEELNKIRTTLLVDIEGTFYDDEASAETLRYCVEQDLEDAGFNVINVSMK